MIKQLKNFVLSPKNRVAKIIGAIFLAPMVFGVVVGIVVAVTQIFFGPPPPPPVPPTPKQIAMYHMHPDLAFVRAERYIKENLRDPDSYERIGFKVWVIDTLERKMGVYIHFRARNGFGGMNVEKYMFTFDKDEVLERTN